ncbi:hypothetical protein [uncultured Roseobacter sp.]|uniref:hypothetical protein n=1 Tax=uncultured Roseobacter sp. TaxID=114847 RepID=UPI0026390B36|nr:hypothetical protein [uncultured Roseobacter sp.]
MTRLELFTRSQMALERCKWKGRQSQSIFETAVETIEQSKRLMELARNPQPIYRAAKA